MKFGMRRGDSRRHLGRVLTALLKILGKRERKHVKLKKVDISPRITEIVEVMLRNVRVWETESICMN